MKYQRTISILLLLISLITYLIYGNIDGLKSDIIGYLKFTYKITLILGLIAFVPWKDLDLIFIDAKEFTSNESYKQLIRKLRFRSLLFKNLSVLILIISIITIGFAVYTTITAPKIELEKTVVNWDLASIKIGAIFLLIFLIHILFRVFRYIVRLSGYYDGISDALEIYLIDKEKHDLSKLIELLIPIKYDIRELKQTSVAENLKKLIK
ncbi:hypothetical protein [Kordia sp.]|uniref:hypothetical protein n=1 Tax=Kordia sp. TaxID=1965332 RepID=UPI003D6A17C2